MEKKAGKRNGLFFTNFEIAAIIVGLVIVGILLAFVAPYAYTHFLRPAPLTKVVVVGQSSQEMKDMLNSEDFRQNGVIFVTDLKPEYVVPGVLDNFDVVLVTGQRECGFSVRKSLAEVVKNGKTLAVFQDACSEDSSDPTAYGWYGTSHELGSVMPARIIDTEEDRTVDVEGRFRILSTSHPLFNGILNFQFNGNVFAVEPNNAEVLAVFGDANMDTPYAKPVYAILEKDSGKGKAIYFSYDYSMQPQDNLASRNLLLNFLLYAVKS